MNIHQFFRFISVDPVNLSVKAKLLSVISSFIAILIVAWVTKKFGVSAAYPILVASMGASAVILFITPNSPLAQPWPLIGCQLGSAIVGITCAQHFCSSFRHRRKCACYAIATLPASSRRSDCLDAHHCRRSCSFNELQFCADTGRH